MPDASPFLHRYRNSIRMKFLLGLCPFSLHYNGASSFVRVKRWNTIYNLLYSTILVAIYMFVEIRTLLTLDLTDLTGTRLISIRLEQLTMSVVFPVILGLQFANRYAHAHLLNRISVVYDSIIAATAQMGTTTVEQRRHSIWGLNALNASLFCFYYAWAIVASITTGNLKNTLLTNIYLTIYALGMCTVLLVVLHVRDVVLLLVDVQGACVAAIKPDAIITNDRILATLIEVQQLRDEFEQCFGRVLLVCDTKDIIIITSMSFYLLSEAVFGGDEMNWRLWNFWLVFFVPILVTNTLAYEMFDRLEEHASIVHRCLARWDYNSASTFMVCVCIDWRD